MPEQDMPAQGGISTGILEAMGEVMAPKSPSALEATGAHSSGISSSSGDAATRRTTLSGEERKPDATALDTYALLTDGLWICLRVCPIGPEHLLTVVLTVC